MGKFSEGLLKKIPDDLLKNLLGATDRLHKLLDREYNRRVCSDYAMYNLDYFCENPDTAILYNKTDLDYLVVWADNNALKSGYDLNPFWPDMIMYDKFNYARIKVCKSAHAYIITNAEEYEKEVYFNPSLFTDSGWEL